MRLSVMIGQLDMDTWNWQSAHPGDSGGFGFAWRVWEMPLHPPFEPDPSNGVFNRLAWVVLKTPTTHVVPMSDEPACCSFWFSHGNTLYEGGFDPPSRISPSA
jgi:hypothetical protein